MLGFRCIQGCVCIGLCIERIEARGESIAVVERLLQRGRQQQRALVGCCRLAEPAQLLEHH
jgi:hypothetical protein